jgi:holo-[acyl-carrier protein] synthase
MTVLLGVDIVAISRVERLLDEHPDRLREFAFTTAEQSYCEDKPFPAQHYAARWSAKEAYIKAVDATKPNPDLTSIEVTGETPPQLSLSGDARDVLETTAGVSRLEDVNFVVSLSHDKAADVALAVVLGVN